MPQTTCSITWKQWQQVNKKNNEWNPLTTSDSHPGVNLHIDGVQVLVGSPDVDVFYDGTDADALKDKPI